MTKILVVEDEEHIQRLIEIILQKMGLQSVKALSGEEALKILDEGLEPSLILLDILMPGVDGLQVLRTIKENPKLNKIPVLMLTALSQENVVIQGIKLGAVDYIRKPFHPKDLQSRIQHHLNEIQAS